MTIFWEGDHVDYVGDGADGLPPAQGKIMANASESAVHVEWLCGPRQGAIDMVSVHDLEKSASLARVAAPTVTASVLVRRVMHREGSTGVLDYLATTHQLGSWEDIAADTLRFVQARLQVDASMELPYETLTQEEISDLIRTSALVLLRDKFTEQGVA